MTRQDPDKTLELVSAAYGAAIDPDRFGALVAAWDAWCDMQLNETEAAFTPISAKFEEAVTAAERLKSLSPQASAIDATQAPMILLDQHEAVIAANAAASSLIATGDIETDHLLASRKRSAIGLEEGAMGAYRCQGTAGGRGYLAVEAPALADITAEHPQADKVLILSLLDWDDAFAADLRQRFGLSDAELRVARGLLEGQTAQEIADAYNRSLATIRSHIKALLTKTSARRQTELVQLLTILRQTSDPSATPPGRPGAGQDFGMSELPSEAGNLSVVTYGAGHPALYFTSSSLPEETPAVRAALAGAGLRVVAPARPGFRGTAKRGKDATDALLDQWLDPLSDMAGAKPLLIGHREGGILAARAAARMLARGDRIAGLVLISTGAPIADIAAFEDAPPTIKRSFLSARYAQTALSLGYHTAARVFRTGRTGEDKIIEYFYRDSPVDAALMADAGFRQITRDNIAYCFNDPSQIARDLEAWGADWSASLHAVAAQVPVLFLHGAAHAFHLTDRISALVEAQPNITARIFEGCAQMVMYQMADEMAEAIAGVFGQNAGDAR